MSFDPSAAVPEKDMRILRPIGLGLLALCLGGSAAWLLLPLVPALGGPDLTGYMQLVMYPLSAVIFVLLMRRSRRKRERAAMRAAEGRPPPVARMMIAGVLAMVMGVACVWIGEANGPLEGVRGLLIGAMMALPGLGAFLTGLERIRARRRSKPGVSE